MSIALATWLVNLTIAYAAVGCLFAVPFVLRGAAAIDPAARQGSWGFRLLILPGAAAFWPLLAWRWLRGVEEPPEESNAHRCAARRDAAQRGAARRGAAQRGAAQRRYGP